MNYPNKIKKKSSYTSHKNRGLFLEELINKANVYYIEQDIAFIYKKPTPIGIKKVVGYNVEGYFKEPSTLDYNGLYKGYYIEFDAKECSSKTSFPLKNIHLHQIKHMENIHKNKGVTFLIIFINEKYFLFPGEKLFDFIKNNERKSIPFEYILKNSFELTLNYSKGLDYIKHIDKLLEER